MLYQSCKKTELISWRDHLACLDKYMPAIEAALGKLEDDGGMRMASSAATSAIVDSADRRGAASRVSYGCGSAPFGAWSPGIIGPEPWTVCDAPGLTNSSCCLFVQGIADWIKNVTKPALSGSELHCPAPAD